MYRVLFPQHWLLTLLILSVCVIAQTSEIIAQPSPVNSGPGALLMKHGDIIAGELTPMGDQVAVKLDESNQIFVPVRQIEFSAESSLDIYRYKIQKLGRLGTGEHYQTALWCLRNKLNDQAIFHYEELRKLVPNDPIVKRLAFQLKETLLQEQWAQEIIRQQRAAKQTQASGVSTAAHSTTDQTALNSKSAVIQAAGAMPNSSDQQVTTAGSTDRPLSIPKQNKSHQPSTQPNAAYEPMVSEDSIRLFRSHLQPILIQKCGQSGCHGMQANNELKLIRPTASSVRKTAESNITSLKAFIDSSDSTQTTLWKKATQAHGNQRTAALGHIDNDGSDELKGWLNLINYQTMQQKVLSAPLGNLNYPDRNANPSMANAGAPGMHAWQHRMELLNSSAPPGEGMGARPTINDAPQVEVKEYNNNNHPLFAPNIASEVSQRELDELDAEVRRAELAESGESASENNESNADPFDPAAFNNTFRKPE